MNFSELKFNCSDLPQLMSNGRENKPLNDAQKMQFAKIKAKIYNGIKLTKTDLDNYEKFSKREDADGKSVLLCKANETVLKRIYSREKYGKQALLGKENIPHLVNGVVSERDSLKLASEVLGIKPKVYKDTISNDHIKGRIDAYSGSSIKKAKHIYEIKTASNYETFLDFIDNAQEESLYYWQMQGYLSITGAKRGTLIHCCTSYHPDIVTQQVNIYLSRIKGLNLPHEYVSKRIEHIRKNMNFDDIPAHQRVYAITIERNDDDIDAIRQKMALCRDWLVSFEERCSRMNK
jgi:hypothetical protein